MLLHRFKCQTGSFLCETRECLVSAVFIWRVMAVTACLWRPVFYCCLCSHPLSHCLYTTWIYQMFRLSSLRLIGCDLYAYTACLNGECCTRNWPLVLLFHHLIAAHFWYGCCTSRRQLRPESDINGNCFWSVWMFCWNSFHTSVLL